jgi:hypothetical protein
MITPQLQQEGLSMAYVRAIAAKAGYNVEFRKTQYKVDGTFHIVRKINGSMEESGYPLDFELKSAMATQFSIADSKVKYDLDVGNYNQLVRRAGDDNAVRQILILFCMPIKNDEWISITENELIVRKCCFWHQLHKEKITENESKIRIEIPTAQQFTPEVLDQIFQKMTSGEKILC